jgi:hypothetical protein
MLQIGWTHSKPRLVPTKIPCTALVFLLPDILSADHLMNQLKVALICGDSGHTPQTAESRWVVPPCSKYSRLDNPDGIRQHCRYSTC